MYDHQNEVERMTSPLKHRNEHIPTLEGSRSPKIRDTIAIAATLHTKQIRKIVDPSCKHPRSPVRRLFPHQVHLILVPVINFQFCRRGRRYGGCDELPLS